MRYSSQDPHLLMAFEVAQLTDQQRGLIQALLRALDPDAFLSNHCSAANSAFVALTRANSALIGYSTQGQPRPSLLLNIIQTARLNVVSALPTFAHGSGQGKLLAAQRLLDLIASNLSRNFSQVQITNYAARLGRLVAPVALSVRSWIGPLWTGNIPAELADSMRGELSVVIALGGRDGLALRDDLQRLLELGPPSIEALTRAFWPPFSRYHLTFFVEGARKLLHLDRLLPAAQQRSLSSDARANLPAKYSALASDPSPRGGVLIQFSVDAADTHTAIALGRRKVSEVLDQYAAGQRVVTLSLSPITYATTSKHGRQIQNITDRPTTSVARPLTSDWSSSLGPALRAAHLAAQVDAPMTATALAWSAIESIGINSNNLGLLAKACALHVLRQQLISTYGLIAVTAGAHIDYASWRADQDLALLTKFERGAERCRAHPESTGAKTALLEHLRRVNEMQSKVTNSISHSARIRADILPLLDSLRAYAPADSDGRVLDPDKWMDILLPPRQSTTASLVHAQIAAGSLSRRIGGLADEAFALWCLRLASPPQLRQWMQSQEEVFRALLYWLYATRNLSIHTGVFSGPADMQTAHAARGVVDMTLEFLGNWRANELSRHLAQTLPLDIVRELASRRDDLDLHLVSATNCHPLSVSNITGPDVDIWTRP